MEGFEDKLNSLLSSPDSMDKIMAMVKKLSGSDTNQTEPAGSFVSQEQNGKDVQNEEYRPVQALAENSAVNTSQMLSAFDSLDPKMISMAMQLMKEYDCKNDKRVHVLHAIKPYLKNEDLAHIDKAIQILKLSKVAKKALRSFSGGEMNV